MTRTVIVEKVKAYVTVGEEVKVVDLELVGCRSEKQRIKAVSEILSIGEDCVLRVDKKEITKRTYYMNIQDFVAHAEEVAHMREKSDSVDAEEEAEE